MIYTIASRPNLKLSEAVSVIANLKLIQRLQFRVLDSFYKACADLDAAPMIAIENQTADDSLLLEDRQDVISADIDDSSEKEPICIAKFEELASQQHSKSNYFKVSLN